MWFSQFVSSIKTQKMFRWLCLFLEASGYGRVSVNLGTLKYISSCNWRISLDHAATGEWYFIYAKSRSHKAFDRNNNLIHDNTPAQITSTPGNFLAFLTAECSPSGGKPSSIWNKYISRKKMKSSSLYLSLNEKFIQSSIFISGTIKALQTFFGTKH